MTNLFLRISDVLSYSKYLCFLWISITFIACSKPPPLKLTSTQRTEVDTLYLRIVNPLGRQLDSTCEANKVKKIQPVLLKHAIVLLLQAIILLLIVCQRGVLQLQLTTH